MLPYDGAALWVLPRVKQAALIAGDGLRSPARLAVVVHGSSALGPAGMQGSVGGGACVTVGV